MRMSLPTVAEVMSSAVLAGEVAPVAAPLADVETVIVGMISLMEAGCDIPVESLRSERVTQACLPVDVGVGVLELSLVVSARADAVSMSLPAIAGVVSSAVFAGGGGGGLLLMQPFWPSVCPNGCWKRTTSQFCWGCRCASGTLGWLGRSH